MNDDIPNGLTYSAILHRMESPTPAQKIRDAANAAADEAAPFIMPTGELKIGDTPYDTPDPEKDLAVLEAVEKRLALMEGQQRVTPDRMEALRSMVRDGLTRYEGKERIIAFYTSRLP